MLNWTGDPLVDIGMAVITAMSHKRDPSLLTEADLDGVADWIEENYVRDPLKSFLTVAFTSNAWFAQDAYNPDKKDPDGKYLEASKRIERKEKRTLWATRHLRGWKTRPDPDANSERCVFTGLPVGADPLSGKLMNGRAGRAQIPLIQGDEDINFYPYGDPGLAISGEALLCLQAFPLGCAKVAGKLLAVHASDPDLTFEFAQKFLANNREKVQLAQAAGEKKLSESQHSYGTLLVETLVRIMQDSDQYANEETKNVSVTAYYLTNGQTPEIDIFHLPLGITRFLIRANGASYKPLWNSIVQAAWQRQVVKTNKKGVKKEDTQATFVPYKNYVYEDLLKLPDGAARFLRNYFLRNVSRAARLYDDDPRKDYSTRREVNLVSWSLTTLFLQEVMNMEKSRVEHIRVLGDRLADYVSSENDRKFFRRFFEEQQYNLFRNAIIKADTAAVRHGNPPLISFDQFIEIFEDGDEIARSDWRLARDLVLIRMIEQLYTTGWLATNVDALPDASSEEENNQPAQVIKEI